MPATGTFMMTPSDFSSSMGWFVENWDEKSHGVWYLDVPDRWTMANLQVSHISSRSMNGVKKKSLGRSHGSSWGHGKLPVHVCPPESNMAIENMKFPLKHPLTSVIFHYRRVNPTPFPEKIPLVDGKWHVLSMKSPVPSSFFMVNPSPTVVPAAQPTTNRRSLQEKFYNGWAILCIVVLVTWRPVTAFFQSGWPVGVIVGVSELLMVITMVIIIFNKFNI